jgi:lipopolysaccharide/colanic/teichoic acid biosynthesis glycosyltransferase
MLAPKLVITGASGHVGRLIVPLLKAKHFELALIGRDIRKLATLFPEALVYSYGQLEQACEGAVALIHLAVENSNSQKSAQDFEETNVSLALDVANRAAACGVKLFFQMSSVHAIDESNSSLYAASKRQANQQLLELKKPIIHIAHLGTVWGKALGGKLGFLNTIPNYISAPLFKVLAALKPTTSAERIAQYIAQSLDDRNDAAVILTDNQSANFVYKCTRRLVDIIVSILGLVFFSWLFLAIWLAIKRDGHGPAIFSQKRIGLDGTEFTCQKFRTMQQGTSNVGTHEVDQAAITRIGRFLRHTKLDELPQLWNVLKGEMSLVGPRPALPKMNELNADRAERGVLKVLPGITGYAQVRGVTMETPQLLSATDAEYVALRCLVLDAKIVWQTFFGFKH